MRGADLHLHSTASDGRFPPREVMRRAFGCDLKAVALTDHDTLAGLQEARSEARRLGLTFVPGCELSAQCPEVDVHVLAYDIDAGDADLRRLLDRLRTAREERVRAMVARLHDLGLTLAYSDVASEAERSSALGRSHVARALWRKGWVASPSGAFGAYIGEGRPAHVPKRTPPPEEVVAIIWGAGGVPVIAHPGLYGIEDLESFFAHWDVGGIEVGHPGHAADTQLRLQAWADRRGWIATAGSDWHGDEDPAAYIGCRRAPDETLERLRAQRRV